MSDATLTSDVKRRYSIREGLHLQRLDDEAVVYDLVQDSVHYLNAAARLIWEACEQGMLMEDIVTAIQRCTSASDAEVTRATIREDVERTLASLGGQGLIVVE